MAIIGLRLYRLLLLTSKFSCINPSKALIVNATGRQDKMDCFTNDFDVLHSFCSLTWHNGFYLFGGVTKLYKNEKKEKNLEISKVEGTSLTVIGQLGFNLKKATCNVMGRDKIFLCFNTRPSKEFTRYYFF